MLCIVADAADLALTPRVKHILVGGKEVKVTTSDLDVFLFSA